MLTGADDIEGADYLDLDLKDASWHPLRSGSWEGSQYSKLTIRMVEVDEPPDLQLKYPPESLERLHQLIALLKVTSLEIAVERLRITEEDLPQILEFINDYQLLKNLKAAIAILDEEVDTPPPISI